MGGRFPALAVFGLPALTVALALVVLWGLRPWEDSADPHEVPLGIEAAVGGGKALPAPSVAGVGAGVAAPAGPKVQVAQRATGGVVSTPSPAPNSHGSPATIVVAPARAIAVAEAPSLPAVSAPKSGGGEEIPSVGATTGEAPPEGTSSPVAIPPSSGGGASQGPVSAGAKPPVLESCEGDEYVIAITFLDEESTLEDAPVDIVLKRLNDDGTTGELQLEGDLGDARTLASRLEGEGSCVEVEIAQPEEESAQDPGANKEAPAEPERSEEVPGSGEEVVEPGESPVPASP